MIQTSESSVIHVGNNSATVPYPVPFFFQTDEDLVVVNRNPVTPSETVLVLGTDYLVTGKGNPNGGSIKTTVPLPVTNVLSINRVVPMTQLVSYEEGDAFPAKSHEGALDKLTMEVQQLSRSTGTGTGLPDDEGTAFRVTTASGGIKSLSKKGDTMVGLDSGGEAILRTPKELLSWLGQVGTVWNDDLQRAQTRGAFAGQTGVQISNWTIYVARSTEPGDWVPHLKESGVVISTNGTPTAKFNPDGDIVGTTHAQILINKTLNNCAIHNPTGLTAADVGLGNVDNTSDEDAPVSIPIQIALQGKQDLAVKGYAQGYASLDGAGKVPIEQIPVSLIGGNPAFQTSWNANTNTPTIATGSASSSNNGYYYLVSVAGTTTVDGTSVWAVGDMIISDGALWKRILASSPVSSVAGKIGAVTLVKADVGLDLVDNTSDITKNAAAVTLTNHTIKGSQNTVEVRLNSADVINNLPVSKLNGGTGATDHTWWCGDGTWKQPQGTGDTTSNTTSATVGEAVVYADTDGKHIKGFSGAAGFAIFTPGNAVTTVPKIGPAETSPTFIHDLTEKITPVEDDEAVIWDSVTGQLMKCKKKNLGVPVGTIIDYAGGGGQPDNNQNVWVPQGWFVCNGNWKNRLAYPALAAVLGSTWGAGDANSFVLPDLRGFVTASRDYSEETGDPQRLSTFGAQRYTIGGYMGAQTHVVDWNQMPAHGHSHASYFKGYHNAAVNGNYGLASINCGIPCGVGFNGSVMIFDGNNRGGYVQIDDYGAGGNAAHNNTQPTRIVWKLIKY